VAVRTAVRADLRAAGLAAGLTRPRGVVIVRPASGGMGPRVAPFESNVPDSVLATGLRAALPRLAEWPDSSRLLHVRLDDDGASNLGAPVTEPPELDNLRPVTAAIRRVERRLPVAGNIPAPVLRLLVTRDGRVAFAEVQATSGEEAVDQAALEIGWTMEFTPAIAGDAAVDVWVSLPVRFGIR
jgi:protein TonB